MRHNTEFSGTLFKYDLPVVNTPIMFRKSALAVIGEGEEDVRTSNQKLLELLEVDKDTAFESFIIKNQQEFNNEVDMYGDIQRAGDS